MLAAWINQIIDATIGWIIYPIINGVIFVVAFILTILFTIMRFIFAAVVLFLKILLSIGLGVMFLWPVAVVGRAICDAAKSVIFLKNERAHKFGHGFALGIAVCSVATAILMRGHEIEHHAPAAEVIVLMLFCAHLCCNFVRRHRGERSLSGMEDFKMFWKEEFRNGPLLSRFSL